MKNEQPIKQAAAKQPGKERNIMDLPDEILLVVANYLKPKDMIVMREVSKRMRYIFSGERAWAKRIKHNKDAIIGMEDKAYQYYFVLCLTMKIKPLAELQLYRSILYKKPLDGLIKAWNSAENLPTTGKIAAIKDIDRIYNDTVTALAKINTSPTPLEHAIEYQFIGLLSALVSAGAKLENESAFITSTEKGHTNVVALLLKNNFVDVNARNTAGRTVLSAAVIRGDSPMVMVLLSSNKIDLNYEDAQQMKALGYAVREKKPEILALLLSDTRLKVTTDEMCALRLIAKDQQGTAIAAILLNDNRMPKPAVESSTIASAGNIQHAAETLLIQMPESLPSEIQLVASTNVSCLFFTTHRQIEDHRAKESFIALRTFASNVSQNGHSDGCDHALIKNALDYLKTRCKRMMENGGNASDDFKKMVMSISMCEQLLTKCPASVALTCNNVRSINK